MSEEGAVTTALLNVSVPSLNVSDCDQAGRSAHRLFILVYSVLYLVGLLLNGFTLWFHCCRPLRKASKSLMIYLKNLTAADFLLCLSLPLRIVHYAPRSIAVHLLYCSFGASMLFLNMYASILFMGYIALNRYLKVVHPFGTYALMTTRAACIISTTTWVVLLIPATTYFSVLLSRHEPVRSPHQNCEELHSEPIKLIYKTVHFCAFPIFLLVLVAMLVSYSTTSLKVSQARQRQCASSNPRKLLRSQRKMLVLICIFCFCFVPYHLVRLLYTFLQEEVFYYLKEFTTVLSVLNVCLDPLVYFVFCKDFRVQMRLRSFRVTSREGNKSRGSGEEPPRTMKINTEVSFSTTSRSTGEL